MNGIPTETKIPEVECLTWIDTFYNGQEGIVAVFDTDPVEVSKHKMWYQLKKALLCWLFILAVVLLSNGMDEGDAWIYVSLFGLCFAMLVAMGYKYLQSSGKNHHVAITTGGIRVDPNPSLSITIPFQAIHSCELSSSGDISFKCNTKNQQIRELLGMSNPLYGVLRAQDFVNVVRAMRERTCQKLDKKISFTASKRRKSNYHNIPETRPISWKDPFYDGNDTIIAAFDRDHDSVRLCVMAQRLLALSALLVLSVHVFWDLIQDPELNFNPTLNVILTAAYFLIWLLVAFVVYHELGRLLGGGKHVAVTSEGIRFDNGADYTVILPYDSFQTCQALPYNSVMAIARLVSPGLQKISLDAGPSAYDRSHREQVECVDGLNKMLIGIEQAQEFADLVMAVKRERAKVTYSCASAEDGLCTPLIV